jgi:FKBP-type peptidyl-prolyl cis-trans isomerase FklB
MKKPALFFLLVLSLSIILPACQESKWADWKLQNELWLAHNKTQPGVVTTASGLQYKVIHQGYMRKPSVSSVIKVNYRGSLIDGTVFDSASSAIFSLSKNILGWQEGIPKMNGGGTYIFYVPSALGYDTAKTVTPTTTIPPYTTLIFQVDLIDSQN